MDEIEPLIFTTSATATTSIVVNVAAKPRPISHLLIGRLQVRRARVCWYILIGVWWRRLIWQQPARGSGCVGGGEGGFLTSSSPPLIRLIFVQANTSIRLRQLCGSRHINTVITLITLNSKFTQTHARAHTQLVSRWEADKWFNWKEDFLRLASWWKWVSKRKPWSWKSANI